MENRDSISFPAFQRQSQSSFSSALLPSPSTNVNPPPTISLPSKPTPTTTIKKPQISKKVNARLQLAAALIECDNDRIQAIFDSTSKPARHSPNSPRPLPAPQPKLASQSAIFKPYRDDEPDVPATIYRKPGGRDRGMSNASRLSGGMEDGGRRPSIDFLGVKLPKEKKYAYSTHSRGGSSAGGIELATSIGEAGGHSRNQSLLSAVGSNRPHSTMSLKDGMQFDDEGEDEDQALSDWGVEKFLSEEQRDRIASGRRSRANSIAGVVSIRPPSPSHSLGNAGSSSNRPWETDRRPSSAMSNHSTNNPTPLDPGAGVGAGRARSEIVESATSGGASGEKDLSLLARIKLYRERQENLPPDQWNSPGRNATSGEVVEHMVRNSPRNQKLNLPPSISDDFEQFKKGINSSVPASADTSASNSIGGPTPIFANHFISEDLSGDISNTKSDATTAGNPNNFPSFNDDPSTPSHSEALKKLHTRELSTSRIAQSQEGGIGGADLERRKSALGVTGDRWSDQEDDDDEEDEGEFVDFSDSGMNSINKDKKMSPQSSRPTSPPTNPSHSRTGSLPLDFIGSPPVSRSRPTSPLARSAGTSPVMNQSRSLNFASPRPAVTPLQEFEPPPEGMVGIGSYSRSQSRRNSLMALTAEAMEPPNGPSAIMNPWGAGETGILSEGVSRPLSPESQMAPNNLSRSNLHTSRPGTPSGLRGGSQTPILGVGAILAQDPFNSHNIGPSPFPSPMLRLSELAAVEDEGAELPMPNPSFGGNRGQRTSMPMDGLTTKQLQALARGSNFPEHYGIGGGMGMDESPFQTEDELEPKDFDDAWELARKEKKRKKKEAKRLSKLPAPVVLGHDSPTTPTALNPTPGEGQVGAIGTMDENSKSKKEKKKRRSSMLLGLSLADGTSVEPDLSSSRWSKGKKKFGENISPPIAVDIPSTDYSVPEATPRPALASIQTLDRLDDVDDSATSPPTKGPLKPRGIETYLPSILIMPQPLQGSIQAPVMRLTQTNDPVSKPRSSLYVPEGFVLHNGKGLPPVKQLQVHGASGPRPYFNTPKADGKQKHDAAVSEFLQSNYALRYLAVPVSAPKGIGRRAAVPTTALFRNQLVKHEEEREGWGWEIGSAIGDQLSVVETEDSEEPLQAKITRAEKRREKKLNKEKRKRKAARRERREKREKAIREGKGYAQVGVAEESPNEDLDLSDTSESESETNSEDEWNSEDEKRWIDHSKPAGKLFGKSLLDVASERQNERKSKSRAYGQVDIEEEERADEAYALKAASLGLPLDAASMAPSSAARSFLDKPLGFNDTRERMEATFGTDMNWAREMSKRREEEAKEAEEAEIKRIAEEEFMKGETERKNRKKAKGMFKGKNKKEKEKLKKRISGQQISSPIPQGSLNGFGQDDHQNPIDESIEELAEEDLHPRSRTPVNPPTINLDFGQEGTPEQTKRSKRKGPSEAAAEWFARSSDEESTDSSSEDEAERRKQAMQRARLSRSLGGTGEAKMLAASLAAAAAEEEDDSSSDDGVPLAQIKKGLGTKSSSFASGLSLGAPNADDSSEEELPLAALKAKRKAANNMMGTLDLDFGGGSNEKGSPGNLSASHSVSSLSKAAAPVVHAEDSDEDEDQPLGLVHPNFKVNATASSDEDDKPLGTQHPETARRVINEQAAMIERLQAEAQARNQPWGMGMMGGGGFDPRLSMMGMGMGMSMPGYSQSPMGVGFDHRMSGMEQQMPFNHQQHPSTMPQEGFNTPLAQNSGLPPINISSPTPLPPSMSPQVTLTPMMQDPKVNLIDRWRNEVPADGSSSAENSKPTSEVRV